MSESYPEHEKLKLISDQSDTIGEFLESAGYVLAQYQDVEGYRDPMLLPVSTTTQQILANYFEIDLKKIQQEKQHMLAQIRQESDTNHAP